MLKVCVNYHNPIMKNQRPWSHSPEVNLLSELYTIERELWGIVGTPTVIVPNANVA